MLMVTVGGIIFSGPGPLVLWLDGVLPRLGGNKLGDMSLFGQVAGNGMCPPFSVGSLNKKELTNNILL